MYKHRILPIILFTIILSGCAGMQKKESNTADKTNQLSPGMSYEEVVRLLGQPQSSQFVVDKWVLKYSLHDPQRGWMPYRLLLDAERKRLASWYVDEEEYRRDQQMRMQTKRAIQTSGSASDGGGYYGLGGYIPR
jgi:outer membrane protein assembly factor BamE (lipoprotein component of BamABCDE complex)